MKIVTSISVACLWLMTNFAPSEPMRVEHIVGLVAVGLSVFGCLCIIGWVDRHIMKNARKVSDHQ